MLTGDASINWAAPIVCCTAEVLSNMALRQGERTDAPYVVMDEFHYYGDRERGVAWQIPLLDPAAHAVPADVRDARQHRRRSRSGLRAETGREVAHVWSDDRPVPLDFEYRETPIHETVEELLEQGRAPVYVVNFTQRECAELAQALTSARGRDPRAARADRRGARRVPLRHALRQGPAPLPLATASASTTRGSCRSTGCWSSSSPSRASCASSAAPTRSASASTSRSAPCCSSRSRSTTARRCGCSRCASSSRSPAAPGGAASTPGQRRRAGAGARDREPPPRGRGKRKAPRPGGSPGRRGSARREAGRRGGTSSVDRRRPSPS